MSETFQPDDATDGPVGVLGGQSGEPSGVTPGLSESAGSDPSYVFDRETALEPVTTDHWRTRIHPAWNIDTNPNGGYAASAMIRAAATYRSDHPDPLAVNIQFLKSPDPGADADIHVEHLRSGRRTTALSLRLVQGDRLRISMLATMGDLGSGSTADGRRIEGEAPPRLPPPDECVDRSKLKQGVDLPLLSRVDVRLAPRFAEPGVGDRAEIAGWIRLSDSRPVDARCLPLFSDAFPPSVFSLWGLIGWVPTIELTTHVRARPVPGWVKAAFTTIDLGGSLLVEDGTLWDADDRLVARSRQLAMLI